MVALTFNPSTHGKYHEAQMAGAWSPDFSNDGVVCFQLLKAGE